MPDIDSIIDATHRNDAESHPKLSRAEQARINGAKSRGPKTPGGKGRACMNALKHGRYAKLVPPLEIEDSNAYLELCEQYNERYQPADVIERALVENLVNIDWRLTRCLAVETRTIDLQIRRGMPASQFESFNLSRLATAVQILAKEGNVLESLTRSESALIRNRQTVLETLIRLRQHQPRPERTRISYPPNAIDSETIPVSNPAPGDLNPQSDRNEPESVPDPPLAA